MRWTTPSVKVMLALRTMSTFAAKMPSLFCGRIAGLARDAPHSRFYARPGPGRRRYRQLEVRAVKWTAVSDESGFDLGFRVADSVCRRRISRLGTDSRLTVSEHLRWVASKKPVCCYSCVSSPSSFCMRQFIWTATVILFDLVYMRTWSSP